MSDTTAKLIMLYLIFLPATWSSPVAVSIYTLFALLVWGQARRESTT